MRIRVSGKDIDIGEALQAHVSSGLTESTGKYAGRPTDGTVTFSRDGFGFACEIFVHLSTGLTAQANGQAAEIYAAFEQAADEIDGRVSLLLADLRTRQQERSNHG